MRLVMIGVACLMTSLPAGVRAGESSTGDATAGKAFALENCSACHDIAPGQRAGSPPGVAPPFAAIANTRGMTTLAIRAFLFGTHPTMPNLDLSQKEADDVIAYIWSLRAL